MEPNERIKEALNGLGVVVVVRDEYVEALKQVRIMFRVTAEQKVIMPVIDAILAEEERIADRGLWSVHICKHYMRHKGRLVYGWNFTLQIADDVERTVDDICRLLFIMAKHVQVFQQQAELERRLTAQAQNRGPVVATPTGQQPRAPVSRQGGQVPGTGMGGVMHNGEVVEMPLVGVTERRNEPQAPMLTPGVHGLGRRSGVSSKGAHHMVSR